MDAELETNIPDVEEHPEIEKEEHELKNLNDTLVDLQNIYEEIEKSGGVNKTIAAAIESVKSDLLSPNTPVNSFTIETSKTNLTTTTEDIISGIVNTLKFIYKTIATIISKVITFIRRLFNRFKEKDKKNQEVVARAKTLTYEIYELKTRFSLADHKVYEDVFKEVAAEANAELKALHNDLFKEVFSGNAVRAVLAATGAEFNKYVASINNKFIITEKIVNSGDKVDPSDALHRLGEVDKYVKNGNADSMIRSTLKGQGNGTIACDLSLLKDYIYHLEENKTTNQLNYQSVFDMLKSDRVVLSDVFILDLSYSEKNLESLQNRADKLESKIENMSSNFTVQTHLKDSARVVKEEVIAIQDFILSCNKVVSVNSIISNFIYTFINRHYKRLLAEARKSTDIVTQNAAKESLFKNKG